MKITFNWLKQYVDFTGTPQELAERLTMLGLEVESMQKLGGEFDGVVVAEVLTRDKHPNADKLSLCKVADGHGERQIVCGAQNFKAGDKVPLILPGNSLPAKAGEQPVTIKAGKIRGCESQGMLCSPQELGLPDAVDGLLILPPDSIVGQPLAEHLGRSGSDVVYDLEITPNRPDWNSVIGIAREISAVTGHPLRLPEINIASLRLAAESSAQRVSVRVEDPELCPRYTARVICGVKVGPSPAWLRSALEKVGLRSINNVVDVTNYVMLETGQPLHAFDLDLLAGAKIVVRSATEGEKFVTLDGKERELTGGMLLIADETRGLALAGIMGGQNSEIQPGTVNVLLESACFKPQNIRASSKKLDLRTDSSYRFERGADIGICDWASRRGAQLILDSAGGAVLEPGIDVYPARPAPKEVKLRPEKTDALLGIHIPAQTQADFLIRLGFEPVTTGETVFRVPTFRVDVKREADLIEEIGRLYGVDKIPSTAPRGTVGANAFDAVHSQIAECRRLLAGLGLLEAQGQTLISDAGAKLREAGAPAVALQNPLSSDMNVLRPSLLPGLLESLRHNVSRKTDDLALFEIGRVFVATDGKFKEERRLGIALTGRRAAPFWSGAERDAKLDIYDLKGILEEFLEQFGLGGITWAGREAGGTFYLESATLQLGKLGIGEIGQLAPGVQKIYDLRDAVFLAELNFDLTLARRNSAKTFKPLAAHPAIRRDIAMLLPEATLHEAVLSVVRQAKPQNLEKAELFDVFRGKNVPEGQKSMAYAFTYRGADRTLTDAEVNAAHAKLVEQLRQSLHATVRDASVS